MPDITGNPMRHIVLLLAALVLGVPMAGSTPRQVSVAAPPRPLLWKLSDADTDVYLLGSFHLLKKSDYPLSSDVENAIADAEALAFEIAPSELDDPSLPLRMAKLALGDARTRYGTAVPAPIREQLKARMDALGLPVAQLENFEPWFVDVTLVTTLAQRLGYSPENGLDRQLMARAKSAGKPTSGLETLDVQLASLDGTPLVEQVRALEDIADPREDLKARFDELHGAWRNGDAQAIERLTREEMQDKTPETYRIVNVERNRAWLPKIEAMLEAPAGHDTLVVVGALHLLGPDGLVAQLKARGLRIERVCTRCEAVQPRRGH